jgi:hypothetical protein
MLYTFESIRPRVRCFDIDFHGGGSSMPAFGAISLVAEAGDILEIGDKILFDGIAYELFEIVLEEDQEEYSYFLSYEDTKAEVSAV